MADGWVDLDRVHVATVAPNLLLHLTVSVLLLLHKVLLLKQLVIGQLVHRGLHTLSPQILICLPLQVVAIILFYLSHDTNRGGPLRICLLDLQLLLHLELLLGGFVLLANYD